MEEKKSLMEEWEDDELTAEQEDQKAKKGLFKKRALKEKNFLLYTSLLSGIGAGVAFGEFSGLAYGGAEVVGKTDIVTRDISKEIDPEHVYYTHLDVYKRQASRSIPWRSSGQPGSSCFGIPMRRWAFGTFRRLWI